MGDAFIPVNTPVLGRGERDRLVECIDTAWISSEGPYVREFEERCAASVGRAHAVAVSSGTALNLGTGDEVIMPTFTIISCIQQVIRCGATPVLVDSDPLTWNSGTSPRRSKRCHRAPKRS
jgi:perosamine synthetase